MVKKGLGKGLSALIPENESTTNTDGKVIMLPIDMIKANPDQPRKRFSPDSLNELAESIKENGIIQPLIVTKKDGVFYLIAGERRLRASALAGLTEVPGIIRNMDDVNSAAIAIIENIQRENLSPIEESIAYQKLIDTYLLTQEMLAIKLGKSRTYITNSLRLLHLPGEVKAFIEENIISSSHGRSILSVPSENQLELANFIIKHKLSVRETEALVKDFTIDKIRPHKNELKPEKDVHIKDVEHRLEGSFGTKVTIKGKNKGSITLDYYSKEDLMRITDLLLSK
ncbi:MAG: ParB/RepB/Spo0J family partition protein [Firmicutes bacterium]|nr:ParB/RepB/Spo0J family partition protein [Bacillota bacterium]